MAPPQKNKLSRVCNHRGLVWGCEGHHGKNQNLNLSNQEYWPPHQILWCSDVRARHNWLIWQLYPPKYQFHQRNTNIPQSKLPMRWGNIFAIWWKFIVFLPAINGGSCSHPWQICHHLHRSQQPNHHHRGSFRQKFSSRTFQHYLGRCPWNRLWKTAQFVINFPNLFIKRKKEGDILQFAGRADLEFLSNSHSQKITRINHEEIPAWGKLLSKLRKSLFGVQEHQIIRYVVRAAQFRTSKCQHYAQFEWPGAWEEKQPQLCVPHKVSPGRSIYHPRRTSIQKILYRARLPKRSNRPLPPKNQIHHQGYRSCNVD